MNKELADKVLAAARTIVGDQCQVMLAFAYAGNDAVWVVLVCHPNRTGHDGWLSTWSEPTLESLLESVEAYHAKRVELHASEPKRPDGWLNNLTNGMGRG